MIRILTDSASDLTATDSARPGVYTVPLSVTFADGTGGLDGVELTADEFYAHLKVDKVPPRTSQPSPQSFMTIFEDAKENGDQVIAILISSNLSGTYQCARLAAESCDFEDVFFVDSRTASQGEAILVREALRLRDEEHLPAHAIVAELEQLKQRIRVLAVVDSLKHLHKGGRLPAAVALVGGALSSRCFRSWMGRSSWRTRPAAAPARLWQCLRTLKRWAGWTLGTGTLCCIRTKKVYWPPSTITCTKTCT